MKSPRWVRIVALFALAWFAGVHSAFAQDEPSPRPASARTTAGADTAIPDQNLLEIIHSGGLPMYPILLCSFILMVFTFERAISLRRGHIIPKPFVKRFLHQLNEGTLSADEALERCEENDSAVAQVFAGAVRKWGRSAVEVEQAFIDAGERVTNGLRKHLRVINTVATVSPLLGLFGTVVGMIQAFNVIAYDGAMGRAELLAGGISQALLTTAAGLLVAIPALIIYLYFVSTVDRRIMEIDALGQEVVQLVSEDAADLRKRKARRSDQKAAA